ncbi:lipopolysaccharide biosynthesis protein [Eubacterium sp. An3]|uniref:lipopolysaccharide biosynthesis protein n=1 Tax=Eubacterium sp. An3 TaxID=1965628 RepID=UPI000B369387|nr:lipopolysaccharide biosynthesis protein [Eubacterium sp. An3]OUO28888.1 lipopolysaccharide biosynthesis protein [Eubacterium sp. An3]
MNRQEKNSNKIVSNLLWRFLERCGAQGVSFIVSIVLARLVAPEAYGTIALVTVFSTILQVFVDSGMANALIQKKNADNLDFSTVFFFNIVACCVLYTLIFLVAPFIALFYQQPELTAVVRVLCLTVIISGIRNVQQAYVSKTMQFKRFFFATIGGTLVAAVVGIIMAYMGFGVWALVAQQILNIGVGTLILWITVKWRPQKQFSFQRLRGLFSYGWKLLAASLIDRVYNELRSLIIGKMYSATDLAYYNRGNQFPNVIVTNINTSIDSVLLPTMSAEQDHQDRVRAMTRRAIKTSTYIMMPLMMGLAICAEPIVRILLTEVWLPCVPYLRIFCFTFALYPIHTANLNAIKAMGRSDMFLKLEIIKKIVGLIALISTMWFGVIWMAYSLLFTAVISSIINAFPNRKLLNYSYLNQIQDMCPQIVLSCIMGGIVYIVQFIGLNDIVTLILQIILGAIIYISGSALFKLESFIYLWKMIKNVFSKGDCNK